MTSLPEGERWVETSSRGGEAVSDTETGHITGTKDKDYDNIIWFTEQCLSNVLRLETYIKGRALSKASGYLLRGSRVPAPDHSLTCGGQQGGPVV
jgi:hypothetical protein